MFPALRTALTAFALFAILAVSARTAQAQVITTYTDGSVFAENSFTTTYYFDGLADPGTAQYYGNDLSTAGVDFNTNSGLLFVIDPGYIDPTSGNPDYVYGDGSHQVLQDNAQASTLTLTFPDDTTAIGLSLGLQGTTTMASSDTITVMVQGNAYDETIPIHPTLSFFGITSSEPISSITLTGSSSAFGVTVANFSTGVAGTPEPGSLALLAGLSLSSVMLFRRRRYRG